MLSKSSIINEVKPLNLLEERQKFFADTSYNPQFVYQRSIDPAELTVWGVPKEVFFRHALEMMAYWNRQGKDEYPKTFSPRVTQEFVVQEVEAFNSRYNLSQPVSTLFSETTIARCMLKGNTLVLRANLDYTQNTFRDVMRHELETHYLRRYNHALQPWGKEKFPDFVFRRTEEGLANLHTFLFRPKKLLFKTYRTYVATYYAQRGSFVDVFNQMVALGISEETSFNLALRTKRGIEDTSQPGGLTKDVSYLEGSVAVWAWLQQSENDPKDLYLGRISLEQIPELKPESTTEGLLYPSFFTDMTEYREHITVIGKKNHFDTLIAHVQENEEE